MNVDGKSRKSVRVCGCRQSQLHPRAGGGSVSCKPRTCGRAHDRERINVSHQLGDLRGMNHLRPAAIPDSPVVISSKLPSSGIGSNSSDASKLLFLNVESGAVTNNGSLTKISR